jgi:hypothetical protein
MCSGNGGLARVRRHPAREQASGLPRMDAAGTDSLAGRGGTWMPGAPSTGRREALATRSRFGVGYLYGYQWI